MKRGATERPTICYYAPTEGGAIVRFALLLALAELCGCGSSKATSPNTTPPQVAGVEISPSADTLSVGDTTQLAATAISQTGAAVSCQPFTWSSSVTAVATVSTFRPRQGRCGGHRDHQCQLRRKDWVRGTYGQRGAASIRRIRITATRFIPTTRIAYQAHGNVFSQGRSPTAVEPDSPAECRQDIQRCSHSLFSRRYDRV